jgi:hypothetical protein
MAVEVIVVSDGKPGHFNQSNAIAEMLNPDFSTVNIDLGSARNRLREALMRLLLPIVGRRAVAKMFSGWLRSEWGAFKLETVNSRSVVVSAGTAMATVNVAASALLNAQSIVAMVPSLICQRYFDLMIVPEHDRDKCRRNNCVVTPIAISRFDEQHAARIRDEIVTALPVEAAGQPKWVLAIGGPSKSCSWDTDYTLALLSEVCEQARNRGVFLLLTTSRRTPREVGDWIRGNVPKVSRYFVDAAHTKFNPLPGFYLLGERVFITEDSYSMVSEAVQAGVRPTVIRISPVDRQTKLRRSLALIEEQDLLCGILEPGNSSTLLSGPSPRRVEPNEFYAELRQEVRRRLRMDEVR